MADTLSLDAAVQFAIDRGASVRLVGDDQQLAAIGAGGVLRDIRQSNGALRLTELHRFIDAAEAAASLALREGRPEALDFYLDHGRVHVGDMATTIEEGFSAWVFDRAAGSGWALVLVLVLVSVSVSVLVWASASASAWELESAWAW